MGHSAENILVLRRTSAREIEILGLNHPDVMANKERNFASDCSVKTHSRERLGLFCGKIYA